MAALMNRGKFLTSAIAARYANAAAPAKPNIIIFIVLDDLVGKVAIVRRRP
jgi:hypothetical protein